MTTFTCAVTQCALSPNAIVASVPPQHFEGSNLAKPSNCAAMPRYCSGLEDPSGNPPRPCLFAADGNGGAAEVKRKRLTVGCAFCCPEAFEHATKSRLGKRNIVTRMKQWRAMGSPVYEAVFTFGIPGMCLPEKEARDLRRRAGQVPKLNRCTSWLHKKKARLMTLLKGKPIPMTPELGPVGHQFFLDCTKEKPPSKTGTWGMEIHASVRRYDMYRQRERARGGATKNIRHRWWRLRRHIGSRLSSAEAQGPLGQRAMAWAADEGIAKPCCLNTNPLSNSTNSQSQAVL